MSKPGSDKRSSTTSSTSTTEKSIQDLREIISADPAINYKGAASALDAAREALRDLGLNQDHGALKQLESLGISQAISNAGAFGAIGQLADNEAFRQLQDKSAIGRLTPEVRRIAERHEAFWKTAFCSLGLASQVDELSKMQEMLELSTATRFVNDIEKFELSELDLPNQIDEIIQRQEETRVFLVETEEIIELVENLLKGKPGFKKKVDDWLELNSDELTAEKLKDIFYTLTLKNKSEEMKRVRAARSDKYREPKEDIKKVWATGKYSSRDICAEQEWSSLGFGSYKTARKALINTPDPSPWTAKEK